MQANFPVHSADKYMRAVTLREVAGFMTPVGAPLAVALIADRDNIDVAELNMFRLLATGYEGLGKEQLEQLIAKKHLSEICHGN